MTRKLSNIALIFLLAVTACACSHKEIICPASETRQITVLFDWANATGASPEGMTLYFFPASDKEQIWRYDISGPGGGPVELPAGRYRMVAFNSDLPGILISGKESYSGISASARRNSSGKYIMPTGMLYGATVSELEVTLCGVRYRDSNGTVKECGQSVVRCLPDSLSTIFTVIFKNVSGLEHAASATAIIHGVAAGIKLADRVPDGDGAALASQLSLNPAGREMSSVSSAFYPSDPTETTLQLIVTCRDGKTYSHNFDITPQLLNSPSKHNVIIMIDTISIPEGDPTDPDDEVGDIDVGVDGWSPIEIDVGVTLP